MSKRNKEISGDEESVSSETKRRKVNGEPCSTELTHNHYTVGWVCALSIEQTAATGMLDQRHDDLLKPPNDPNAYTLGSVGKHNIVIACLPKGKIGTNQAAIVATWMISTFPSIKFGLMVGIGGGIPPKVRLGDVVVSTPVDQFPGVVQWDFGKAKQGGNFERIGALNNPPIALLTAVTKLETEHDLNGSKISEHFNKLKQKWLRLASKHRRSDSLQDLLFKPEYGHVNKSTMDCAAISDNDDGDEEGESCRFCDRTQVVKRKPRDMRVHYGLIASGNQVIKDVTFRDKLNCDLGSNVLCVEMEAAGLMNNFPCIVIRGICDYADSHKNQKWQEYAAAIAAAFAKELLEHVQPSDVDGERTAKDILSEVQEVKQTLGKVYEHVRDGFKSTHSGLQSLLRGNELQDQKRILDWLTSIDYAPQQNDLFSQGQQGTGQWLLDSEEYRAWLKTSKQTLFCPGIPGAGKTICTSIVVYDLIRQFQNDPSTSVVYIYCNFRQQDEQRVRDLLASLLKQLSLTLSYLPDSLSTFYKHHGDRQTRPSADEILTVLHSVAAMFSRVFIIVDALDECQVSDGCRTTFLKEIFNLQEKHGANFFATSRFIPDIIETFAGCNYIEIRASKDDVHRYVEGHLGQLLSFVQKNKELQEEIKIEISGAVDGMFLLAQIYLGSLDDKTTPTAIKKALKQFQKQIPGSSEDKKVAVLDQAYELTMERINRQKPGLRELAKHVLSWIAFSKRPLTTSELQHGLGVKGGESELDKENLPQIEDMVSVCAGLVTVDKESRIIRLVHYTTQKYFERMQQFWFPDVESNITRKCVTYLSYSIFESGSCPTDAEFEERLWLNQFYDYAAHNWGNHAREALTLHHEVMDFLKCKSKVEASSQALIAVKQSSWYLSYSQIFPRQMTGLHLAAYFGLKEAMITLLENGYDINSNDSTGRTPLSYAARRGYEEVVKLLLEKRAELEIKDSAGRAPLSYAAWNGHEAVVKLLLEKGAELEAKDTTGQTSLLYAVKNRHKAVVKLMLEKGAELETKDSTGRTPLLHAAWKGHEAVVKLLLEKDAKLETRDSISWTPLLYAARNGYKAVVKLLLEKGARLEVKGNAGRTPLLYAAENGHEAVVKLLLEKGAGLETKDKDTSRTSLLYAARNGHKAVVELLLEKGAKLEAKDKDGRTPLLYAVENGHKAVVKLLLERGARLETKESTSRTPLSYAARYGHEAVVKLLLEKGAKLEAKDKDGQTSLLYAMENRHAAVVKLLLEKGAQLEVKSMISQTSLSWAAESGHEALVKLLLEKGAKPETKDRFTRQTSLLYAVKNGHEAVVKLLLERGAEIETEDGTSRTPLSYAAENGHEAIVKLLLEKGAELETEDSFGWTPLLYAVENGYKAVVMLLLEKGAKLDTKDSTSWMMLSYAAMNGHEAVVELLLERGAKLETKDGINRTPLSYVAENGHEAMVILLLEKGAKLETKDHTGRTPLLHAAWEGHKAVVKLLLEKGAELEIKDSTGRTPLLYATQKGHKAVVKLLLEKGAKLEAKDTTGQTSLLYAVKNRHEVVVKLLLEKGAKLETKDSASRTPLLYAAENGLEAMVKLLLEKGAELEGKDMTGQTSLLHAVRNGHEAVVKLLLEKGAELETKDNNYSQTLLLYAAKNGRVAIVKLLLEKGAELEGKSNTGRTPLLYAAWKGHEAVVKLLLEKGAELEGKDIASQTPLLYAAESGHEAVVKLLLEKGAELETEDSNSRTPLSYAAENGYEAVVKLLLEKGAELETKDSNSRKPLSYAAENGHEAVVKLLLERDAELETKDSTSRTPLSYAAENRHEAVVKLLLEKGAQN